jgi:hypothetical protein
VGVGRVVVGVVVDGGTGRLVLVRFVVWVVVEGVGLGRLVVVVVGGLVEVSIVVEGVLVTGVVDWGIVVERTNGFVCVVIVDVVFGRGLYKHKQNTQIYRIFTKKYNNLPRIARNIIFINDF